LIPAYREILIDVLHNRGTTPNQVQYRLKNHPAPVIHTHIQTLIQSGHIRKQGQHYIELTPAGMRYLIP